MFCPFCRHADTKVSDSRATDDGLAIRRRRVCCSCQRKFTTVEQIQLYVLKRSGVVEAFSREIVIRGVAKACQNRPVTAAQLAALGQRVEEDLRSIGQAELTSEDIGIAILGPLAELDPVAYLRFASVYKNFDSVDDFIDEVDSMKRRQPTGDALLPEPVRGPRRRRRRETDSQEPLIG